MAKDTDEIHFSNSKHNQRRITTSFISWNDSNYVSRLKFGTIANQTKENGEERESEVFNADWKSRVNYLQGKICNALKNARPLLETTRYKSIQEKNLKEFQ